MKIEKSHLESVGYVFVKEANINDHCNRCCFRTGDTCRLSTSFTSGYVDTRACYGGYYKESSASGRRHESLKALIAMASSHS
jgi:hypothetical protein